MEQELMRVLSNSGLHKDHLAALVKTLTGFEQQGIKIGKVFPNGIPPVYDSVLVRSVLTADQLTRLVDVLRTTNAIDRLILHPIGVPQIEQFEAEIVVR